MRFFKAFNLLHRRTRSATFVPGGPHFSLSSAGPNPTTSLSLFDLVTARRPFSDVKDDRWWSRRSRNTNSLASIQPSLQQENLRLVELVDFWTREYSKVQDLLKSCHNELLLQRSVITLLQENIAQNAKDISCLRLSLARCTLAGSSPTSAQAPDLSSIATTDSQALISTSVTSASSDQYSSALRMTLQARKALRDQKKIAKYWKHAAVTGGHQNTVTPSVSAISSVRETLPAHRQAAVDALMAQRGLTTQPNDLRSDGSLSADPSSTFKDMTGGSIATSLNETLTTLPSSSSRSSQFSRLGPLASESLKHEVNSLYGSSGRLKRLSSSLSFLQFNSSLRTNEGLTQAAGYSLSINSFGDLNTLFQQTFGDTHVLRGDIARTETLESGDAVLISQYTASGIQPSSLSLDDQFTSGYSQTWVNIQALESGTGFEPLNALKSRSNSQQTMKENMRLRSLLTLEARLGRNRREDSEVVQQTEIKSFERSGFFISLPSLKKKYGGMPVFRRRTP